MLGLLDYRGPELMTKAYRYLGDTALKTKFSVKFFHKKSKFTKSALGDGLGRPRRAGIPRQKERGDFSLSLLR